MNDDDKLTVPEQAMALRDMFLSRGWIQVMKPRLLDMRKKFLEEELLDAQSFEEYLGIREKVFLLDALIDVEPQTVALVKNLRDNPAEATSVVESE